MNTATRIRRNNFGKNLVVKYNPQGDSTVDLTGSQPTDVVWVRTNLGSSKNMDGRFVRLDEPRGWMYTAIEVFQANPEQTANYLRRAHYIDLTPGVARDVYYTILGTRVWCAGWGPEANWYDISRGAWELAKDAARHYNSLHPALQLVDAKFITIVKLDVNGADLGTYEVTTKLTPEYTVKEIR